MAVLRQLNLLSQQRLDIPHLRSLESAIAADFDVSAGRILSGGEAVVARGFALGNLGSLVAANTLQLSTADGIICNLNATEAGTFLWVPDDRDAEVLNPTTNSRVTGSWTPGQTNYVGLDLVRASDTDTTDLVQFLDANSGLEVPRQVPLARTLDYRIVIGTVPFSSQPNLVPIAQITLNSSSQVTDAVDARPMLFRLASGGDSPDIGNSYTWPQGRTEDPDTLGSTLFTGGDKAIQSQRGWMQAVMSRLWETGGGEFWYSATADRNVNIVWTGLPFDNGENFEWDGDDLHWQGIRFLFDNSSAYFNDVQTQTGDEVDLTDLEEGECLYVDLDRTQPRANQWVTVTDYVEGEAVYNGGNVYICTVAGTSGAGPSGTTTGIVDGGAEWDYVAAGDTALVPVKTTLIEMGSGDPPGSRQVLAWRVGPDIFTRNWRYPVGTTFTPATASSLGVVKLNQIPGDANEPVVVSIMADGQAEIAATANDSHALKLKGHGSGPALVVQDATDVVIGKLWPTISGTDRLRVGTQSNHQVSFMVNDTDLWEITTAGVLQSVSGPRLISSVLTPAADTDAATKAYVDGAAGGAAQNYVINSRFDLWQRGTTLSATLIGRAYVADRWYMACPGGIDITGSRQGSAPTPHAWCFRLAKDNGETGNSTISLVQEIDRDYCYLLRGKKVTLTFWARKGANYSGAADALTVKVVENTVTADETYGDAIDPYSGSADRISTTKTLTTSWQQFTATSAAVVGSSVLGMAVVFEYTTVGTAGAADHFEISGVQLNEGTVSCSYSMAGRTPAGERSICERYYEKSYPFDVDPGTNTTDGAFLTTVINVATNDGDNWTLGSQPRFRTSKNKVPTVSLWRVGGTADSWYVDGNKASEAGFVSRVGFVVLNDTGGPVTPGVSSAYGHYAADAEI